MLGSQHSVCPHRVVIIHRFSSNLLSRWIFVLVQPQEVIDVLIGLICLEYSRIEVLSSLHIFKRGRCINWADMGLSGGQRAFYFPVSLSIQLVSPDEQAS